MILDIQWHPMTILNARLLENGALRLGWSKYSDARIYTETSPDGVGPVVYLGKKESITTGVETYDGVIRDALLMFCDTTDAVYAVFENVDPVDLLETAVSFMQTHGGDITEMQSNKPVVI